MVLVVMVVVVCEKQSDPFQTNLLPVVSVTMNYEINLFTIYKTKCIANFRVNIDTLRVMWEKEVVS